MLAHDKSLAWLSRRLFAGIGGKVRERLIDLRSLHSIIPECQFQPETHCAASLKKSVLGKPWLMLSCGLVTTLIESAITRSSADELQLKACDKVMAVVKATDVMIQKE